MCGTGLQRVGGTFDMSFKGSDQASTKHSTSSPDRAEISHNCFSGIEDIAEKLYIEENDLFVEFDKDVLALVDDMFGMAEAAAAAAAVNPMATPNPQPPSNPHPTFLPLHPPRSSQD